MEVLQKPTSENSTKDTEGVAVGHSPLAIYGNTYIDFCAVQGMTTSEDGEVKRVTVTEFANMIQVHRDTLYDWQKRIPDFWVKVNARRQEIGGQNRIAKVWNGLYLKAASGNPQAAAIYLANYDPNFRMPTEKVEHSVKGGMADLLNQARERKRLADNAVDGEVIDAKTPDNA